MFLKKKQKIMGSRKEIVNVSKYEYKTNVIFFKNENAVQAIGEAEVLQFGQLLQNLLDMISWTRVFFVLL